MKSLVVLILTSISLPAWAHDANPKLDCTESLVRSPIESAVELAQQALPKIAASLSNGIPANERSYYEPILLAAQASVTKHNAQFANKKKWKDMDIPRHMDILRSIAAFDPAKPKFSLYKIKRTIEDRHSLKEYINCLE